MADETMDGVADTQRPETHSQTQARSDRRILDTLAQDHRELEGLVHALAQLPSSEPQQRTETFSRLQALLQAHSRAEEEIVYRRMRAALPEEAKILEAFEEHHIADILLQELASACPGGIGWSAKVKVLEELLHHHIKEEEQTLFALAAGAFDDAAQLRMDAEFQTVKHERMEELLGPLRRATPAFAGRAAITAQAAAGRYARRGELYMRGALTRLRGRARQLRPGSTHDSAGA